MTYRGFFCVSVYRHESSREGVEAEVGCRDILASFMSLLAH